MLLSYCLPFCTNIVTSKWWNFYKFYKTKLQFAKNFTLIYVATTIIYSPSFIFSSIIFALNPGYSQLVSWNINKRYWIELS